MDSVEFPVQGRVRLLGLGFEQFRFRLRLRKCKMYPIQYRTMTQYLIFEI